MPSEAEVLNGSSTEAVRVKVGQTRTRDSNMYERDMNQLSNKQVLPRKDKTSGSCNYCGGDHAK